MKYINGIIFYIALLFTFLIPTLLSLSRSETEQNSASFAFLSGTLIMFFTKLDSIAEFSIGPIKARMKEKIKEAVATIDQLRKVAASIANSNLSQLIYSEYIAGMPLKEKLRTHDELIEQLRDAGLSDDDLQLANKGWKQGISSVYFFKVAPWIDEREDPYQLNIKTTPERKLARAEYDQMGKDLNTTPSPDAINQFLQKHSIASKEADEWVADFRHFLDTGEIRRVDKFCNLNHVN